MLYFADMNEEFYAN